MAESKLVATKSFFKVRGIITGLTNPNKNNGYKEGVNDSGKLYRSIKFLLKTSPESLIPVELFSLKPDSVYFYDKKKKESHKVDYEKRNVKPKNADVSLIEPQYDLIERIHNELKDNDSVHINGEIVYSTYVDKQGQTQQQVKYNIKSIYPTTDPVDFESPDFEEVNEFTQEIIVSNIVEDTKTKKVFVAANTINYNRTQVNPAMFVLNVESSTPGFVKNMKGLKPFDFIKINGVINNRALTESVDGDWGRQTVRKFEKSLQILGADPTSLVKKRYTEKDFVSVGQQQTPKDVVFEENTDEDFGRQVTEETEDDSLPFEI